MVEKWLVVKSFWCMAFDYFNADTALPEGHFGLVRYYLLCHSLELSFKAFLSDKERTVKELSQREFGHNLETLLQECEAKGLAASFSGISGLREQVKSVNKYYADKQFEYSEICFYTLPELTAVRESVGKLIKVTEPLWKEPEYRAATMQP